ncbi:HalOD1 output domain-containing protein [Halopiger djelfimassiliensis]|uniref:HalOD1 output domain-containing protein n=1 Tax=Halopiger djelfimassiliensis TaxID=1293047 RepID=UPI000678164C|nr:HalOD1 output domain-containing protein [Halopiger djelfimassiliensis]
MPSTDDSADGPETQESVSVTTFDPDAGERASEAVVTAVAAIADEDPSALEPLYDVVDPDALDSLVEHAKRVDDAGTHELWFTYEGFDVGVRTDGEIRIRDAATADSNQ